jgi:heme/copper-type cytochrome/quinol oxidase subunit 1
MILRIDILTYNRIINRGSICKLIYRYHLTWYLLRSSSLSLCIINGGSICNHSRIYSLIPFIYRTKNKSKMIKNSIYCNILSGKFNMFPTTFPRTSRNTTTIFRLSRCIHCMEYYSSIGSIISLIRIVIFIFITWERTVNNRRNLFPTQTTRSTEWLQNSPPPEHRYSELPTIITHQ